MCEWHRSTQAQLEASDDERSHVVLSEEKRSAERKMRATDAGWSLAWNVHWQRLGWMRKAKVGRFFGRLAEDVAGEEARCASRRRHAPTEENRWSANAM